MKREAIFSLNAANEPITTCPGCGHENKLSELAWNEEGGAKCTGKACKWRFEMVFKDPKTERPIKPERMDHMEKGAKIGKSREGTITKRLNYKKLWLGLKIYLGHYIVSNPAEPNRIINTVKGLMNEYEKIVPGKF